MKLAQFAASYRSVAVKTAPPGQLILMLFDGALRFLRAAETGFEEVNVVTRFEVIHNNIIKTTNILRELQQSLDLKNGGAFAQEMYGLYDFMIRQIQEANANKEIEPLQRVSRMLGEIRDAWSEMLNKAAST